MKWIYKYVAVSSRSAEEQLNVFGAEGWEVCGFSIIPGAGFGVLLKRPG